MSNPMQQPKASQPPNVRDQLELNTTHPERLPSAEHVTAGIVGLTLFGGIVGASYTQAKDNYPLIVGDVPTLSPGERQTTQLTDDSDVSKIESSRFGEQTGSVLLGLSVPVGHPGASKAILDMAKIIYSKPAPTDEEPGQRYWEVEIETPPHLDIKNGRIILPSTKRDKNAQEIKATAEEWAERIQEIFTENDINPGYRWGSYHSLAKYGFSERDHVGELERVSDERDGTYKPGDTVAFSEEVIKRYCENPEDPTISKSTKEYLASLPVFEGPGRDTSPRFRVVFQAE